MNNNFNPFDILNEDLSIGEFLIGLCEYDDEDDDDYYDNNNYDNNEN